MTGVSAQVDVTAAVEKLDRIGELRAAEHVEVYEEVHRALQDALADAGRDASTEPEADRTATDVVRASGSDSGSGGSGGA